MSHIAIDFGTARTKIARLDEKQNPCMVNLGKDVPWVIPSLFHISTKGEILVGEDAERIAKEDKAGLVRGLKMELHKDIGVRRNGYKLERVALAAEMFRWIREKCNHEVFHNDPVSSCTITVPPGFGAFEVGCLKSAALQGGFCKVDTIEEPVAAARYWLKTSPSSAEFIAVCDIGGGTTDFALVRREKEGYFLFPEIRPLGIPRGGNDIETNILDCLDTGNLPESYFSALLVQIRKAKEIINQHCTHKTIKLDKREFIITLDIINEACIKFINTILESLDVFLNQAKFSGKLDIGSIPLLIIGGGRYIIGIQDALRNKWSNDNVYVWEESERATVLGALIKNSQRPLDAMDKYKNILIKHRVIPNLKTAALKDLVDYWSRLTNDINLLYADLEENDKVALTEKAAALVETQVLGTNLKHIEREIQHAKEKREKQVEAVKNFQKATDLWEWGKNKGSIDEVLRECDFLERHFNDFHPSLYLTALAYWGKGQLDKAMDYLNSYIEKAGPTRSPLFRRGCLRLNINENLPIVAEGAVRDFSDALKAEDSDDLLSDCEVGPHPDAENILICRAYANFLCGRVQESIEDIEAMEGKLDNCKNESGMQWYNIMFLALRCKLLSGIDYVRAIDHFKQLFASRGAFPEGLERMENVLARFPRWREWFSTHGNTKVFADLMKKWIYDVLVEVYRDNSREQEKNFYMIVADASDKDPWVLSNGVWVFQKSIARLINIAGILAESGDVQTAEDYLVKLWNHYKNTSIEEVVRDTHIKKVIKKMERIKPFIRVTPDIKIFKENSIVVKNESNYALNNVVISYNIKFKDGHSVSDEIRKERMGINEHYLIKNRIIKGLRKKDEVLNIVYSCDELSCWQDN